MAQHIRVPGLIDMVLVSDPDEIRLCERERKIDRQFTPRGPLINRLILGRITRWFAIKGELLPSLLPRGDPVRAQRQRELMSELDPANGRPLWTAAQLDRLVSFVRGEISRDDAAITVQEIVGQRFRQSYRADRESLQAAELIDRFRDGFSPAQILWQITGKLRRAWDLLVSRAAQDRWVMHGTAIGMHGIVHALERMRDLRASPEAASLGEDAAMGRCLAPPKQVPRTVQALLSAPVTAKSLWPGTVVMLQLAKAGPFAPDGETVFMQGHWNACPAQAFVTALLQAVWQGCLKEDGSDGPGHHLHTAAVP